MKYLKLVVLSSIIISISGCLGYVSSSLKYDEISTDLKSKSEVISAYGNPLRIEKGSEIENWYYLNTKSQNGSSMPKASGFFAIFIIIPIGWTSPVTENIKFTFKNDVLYHMYELKDHESGFMCSAVPIHPFQLGCHSK